MLAFAVASILALAEAAQPSPGPSPSSYPAPPTPPPLVTPVPSPAPGSGPPTPAPAATAPAAPTPAATGYAYVVAPAPGPSGAPQIVQVAFNAQVEHPGETVMIRVTTSEDVQRVVVRAMGREVALFRASPTSFGAMEQLPSWIPFMFLNHNFGVVVVASTADGRSASANATLRLER